MARIGLFTFPGMGHVNPMAALGRRLQSLGHEVVFFQVQDLEEPIRAAGLGFQAIGREAFPPGTLRRLDDSLAALHGIAALRHIIQRQALLCRMHLETLPDMLRDGGWDLLLVDALEFAPHLVAEHLGIPVMTIDLLPPLFNETSAPPFCFGWPHWDGVLGRLRNAIGNQLFFTAGWPILRLLHATRAAWGMPPIHDLNALHSPRTRIGQMPRFMDFPRRRLPANFHYAGPFIDDAARPPVAFPWERLTGQPLVYASMGTLQNGSTAIFRMIAEALCGLGVQLVISTGGGLAPDRLGVLPGMPIVVRFAPQVALLQRAALVITHGGINTALETLSCGKPMIVVPVTSDQPGMAARLAHLGVADVIPAAKLTAGRLRASARHVLDTASYRQRAAICRAELTELRGLDRAAGLVSGELAAIAGERLVRGRRVISGWSAG